MELFQDLGISAMSMKCRILYSWSLLYKHTFRKFNYAGSKLFISTLVFIPLYLSATNASPVPIDLHHNPRTGRGDIMQMWTDEKYSYTNERCALYIFFLRFPGIMRNALKPDAQNRWIHYKDKKGNFIIPYEIAGPFSPAERKIIHGAMASIAKNTCIHFKKKKKDQFDYVEIQNKRGEGCYTMVGRNPGKNIVMLEANEEATCVLHETVVHELFHTIGLWHEQMRFDRDTYIKIHYENIPPAYYAQFKKVPEFQSTTYGVKYDYSSVMHYAKDAFAMVPGALTMQTKLRKAQEKIGHAKEASKGDYTKVCSIYNCRKCMRKPFKRGQKSDGKNKKKHTKHRRHHKHRKLPNIFKILFDNPIANTTNKSNNNTSQQENISSSDTMDSSNIESDSTEDDGSDGDGLTEDSDSSDDSEDVDSTFFDETDEKFRDISDTWTFEEAIEDILENANISIGGSNQTNIIIVADPNAGRRYTESQSDENNISNSIDVMSDSEIQNHNSEENTKSSEQNESQSGEAEQIRTVVMTLPQPEQSTADESLEKSHSHKHHHKHHHGSHHSHKSQSSIANKSDQMIDQQNGQIEQGNNWNNIENDENTWNEDNPNIQDVQAGDGADIRQSDENTYDNNNTDNYDVQNHGDYNQIDYEDQNNFDGQNETDDQNGFDQKQFYDYGNHGEDENYDDQDHNDDNQIDENDNFEYSEHKFDTKDSDD
ncbi:astacin (Peptidase family m12A) domain-containing protein [Ditylenchus destructor]|nr:astacin (Peptidase family m12A) domain-containing protein [Ditylenchus destructor]